MIPRHQLLGTILVEYIVLIILNRSSRVRSSEDFTNSASSLSFPAAFLFLSFAMVESNSSIVYLALIGFQVVWSDGGDDGSKLGRVGSS